MTCHEEAVARARALVGTPFIAQGRDPAVGLDCVGLIVLAYRLDPRRLPDDYRLGGPYREAILEFSAARFRRVARTQMRAGDVLLLRPGRSQWHLGLWTGEAVIHADVARRMTVERPGLPHWPMAAVLRPRTRISKGS
jgi:cell wall-associated NlpC family hydrolase